MPIRWNKVTWYSKLIAVILFAATFWIAFCLGELYQAATVQSAQPAAHPAAGENRIP